LDSLGRIDGILVFPYTDDSPPCVPQSLIGVGVAGNIAIDFGSPKFGVLLGWPVVLRASVPEAAVEENRNPGAGEDDVGRASDLPYRT
jgi:hypothetical protein